MSDLDKLIMRSEKLEEANEEEPWCMTLHGNHDEHQCHKKPGHDRNTDTLEEHKHECTCGVWW